MKPQTVKKIALLALPLAACGIALAPGSVTVVENGAAVGYNYFQMLPQSNVGWCAPLAAILNYLVFLVAVLFALSGRRGFLQTNMVVSFISTTLAVIPVMAQGETRIVPNVFFALILGIDCLLSYMMLREVKHTKVSGPRLEAHE